MLYGMSKGFCASYPIEEPEKEEVHTEKMGGDPGGGLQGLSRKSIDEAGYGVGFEG